MKLSFKKRRAEFWKEHFYETWSLSLVEELRLRAFENSAMEKWRKLYNRSFRIISKIGGMRWAGHAARLK
jgi:hypothetical protein